MGKFLKITGIVLLSLIVIASALFFTYLALTKDAKLDESKLKQNHTEITLFDDDGNEIAGASIGENRASIKLDELNKNTINAFIASEDRTFYSHKGLNFKRMVKALFRNIASGSFKEGASTISQQLIKNTHLTGDKTISRKLNEIRLTGQLEKRYSKDQILEMYLNTIYFGHNCYGLESAAKFYFGKSANELNLEESATLAGLLSSPNNYSPFKNEEKCKSRRNLVLKGMKDCKFIGENEYQNAINTPINAKKSINFANYADYKDAIFDELSGLDLDFYGLTDGCKIYTYLQPNIQNQIEKQQYPCDNAVIVTNADGGVSAYKSTIGNAKRQPGSTIKPLCVYAPAIEERLISPFTKILDEKIEFGDYSPENADKKYHGYVTVTESIKRSYNIPAVKTLNSLTIDNAEKYLNKMGIELEDDEKNLSLALGGMKYGLTVKQLADAYSSFRQDGIFQPTAFIKKIYDRQGKTIYENSPAKVKAFSEGTCSLMNNMLIETAESGTAKKLKNFDFDVAAKTGTCGNDEGNTDAYAVLYTSQNTIAIWLGDKNNARSQITGGNECCEIAKNILENMYSQSKPQKLETQKGTKTFEIDFEEYDKDNKIIIADSASPKLNKYSVKALPDSAPKEISTRFSYPEIPTPQISVAQDKVKIQLCQTKYYAYLINRVQNGKKVTIYDGKWVESIEDAPGLGIFGYTVTPYYSDGKTTYLGKEITLPTVNISESKATPQEILPDIVQKDWQNL